MLWFERGSDRLPENERQRLTRWIEVVRDFSGGGHLEVEASASGVGANFDRSLSLRRAAHLRDILIVYGIEERRVEVRLQDWYGRGRARGPDADMEANIRRMVVDGRLRHPVLGEAIMECF